ncbi:RNA-directed DNA polymerase [Abeliophyllum distichum]|uniref:RNA-directed DNA polymerase n=1 Tax=Abeliophyllum distichum TaxID=126358 RepID=A0ABD1UQ10_9LAMI
MKYLASSDSCFQVDVVDKLVTDTFGTEYPSDELAICMMCFESTKSEHPAIHAQAVQLEASPPVSYKRTRFFEPLGESPQRPVPSIEKAHTLELKPLPSHL